MCRSDPPKRRTSRFWPRLAPLALSDSVPQRRLINEPAVPSSPTFVIYTSVGFLRHIQGAVRDKTAIEVGILNSESDIRMFRNLLIRSRSLAGRMRYICPARCDKHNQPNDLGRRCDLCHRVIRLIARSCETDHHTRSASKTKENRKCHGQRAPISR